MILDGKRLYEILERCGDLFPEWKKEKDRYWNFKTGEIVDKDGGFMHDLVFRGCSTLEDIQL